MNTRRFITALGAAATAALLTIAVPTSAQAAEGTLYIGDQEFTDPSGCYAVSDDGAPTWVLNDTDAVVFFSFRPSCLGPLVQSMGPGEEREVTQVRSLVIR